MLKKFTKLLSYSNISFLADIYNNRKLKRQLEHTDTNDNSLFLSGKNDILEDNLILNVETILKSINHFENINETIQVLEKLEFDEYNQNRINLYKAGINKFHKNWVYLDLPLILNYLVKISHPKNYLEVGVRRGRSLAIVAYQKKNINICAVDLWGKE